jgi:hypothetical protein
MLLFSIFNDFSIIFYCYIQKLQYKPIILTLTLLNQYSILRTIDYFFSLFEGETLVATGASERHRQEVFNHRPGRNSRAQLV